MIEINTLLVANVAACLVCAGFITACLWGVRSGIKDRSMPFTLISLALLVLVMIITLTFLDLLVLVK
jgi:hypothetical protein